MLFLRASNDQLVEKMNYIEFTVLKAFTSEFRLILMRMTFYFIALGL